MELGGFFFSYSLKYKIQVQLKFQILVTSHTSLSKNILLLAGSFSHFYMSFINYISIYIKKN